MDNWELFEQLEGEFTLMAVNRGDTALYVEVPGFDTLTAQIHVTGALQRAGVRADGAHDPRRHAGDAPRAGGYDERTHM